MDGISRREFVGSLGVSAAASAGAAKATRPNILFICTDNFNPNVLGCAGHPMIRTPNIDRLAKEGAYFNAAYCGSPVCAPARASLFTGMFPSDVDSWCNSTPLNGDRPTWGHRLRDAGYYTMATGKLDLTSNVDLGFEQVDTTHGHEVRPDITSLFRRPLCYRVDERPSIDGRILNAEHEDVRTLHNARSFLRDKAPGLSQPWAMFVGFVGPLPGFRVERQYSGIYSPDAVPVPRVPADYLETMPEPWEATRAYKRIATPIPEQRVRRAIAAYYGNVTAVDERIGEVLSQLERSGLRGNTVVVYTVDHGRSLGEHGMWFHNEPTDHSSRVTMIVSGPGIPAGKRIDTPVMHVDLFPTLLELAGASIPAGLRGHSLAPMWQGRTGNHPGVAYSECHAEGTCTGSFVVRRGKWKYIHYTYYDSLLFNMEVDPQEMDNVIGAPEGRLASKELYEILRSLVDPAEMTERAFRRQEQMLHDLCARMTLNELLKFGFERRLGRGQAISLLKRYKG